MNRTRLLLPATLLAAIATTNGAEPAPALPAGPNHVIHVSIDGLRPDAVTALGPEKLPNFYRMRTEGAFTDNARTDHDSTVTLPTHTCQLTGRGVNGNAGHGWRKNTNPKKGVTIASNKGAYVASVFDVAHDHGLCTGEYASKTKFSLHDISWDGENGAADAVGADDGRDKIDVFVCLAETGQLIDRLVDDMKKQPLDYAFVHLADPDVYGHSNGWDPNPGSAYSNTVIRMDRLLGRIFDMVTTNEALAGRTFIIVTADHGGHEKGHSKAELWQNYTIPFSVWGPGVEAGAALYDLNQGNRLDPGTDRPNYFASVQPIRNGDAANLSLQLLGLPPVPGSTIGQAQDIRLNSAATPSPASAR